MRVLLDRRILGAVQLVDGVTGVPIARTLVVHTTESRWRRNRRGLYILQWAPGLDAHVTSFDAPPPDPPIGAVSLAVQVNDPRGAYLPRQATLALPRDPDPTHVDQPDSLFQAAKIAMLPTPAAPTWAGWAVVRISKDPAEPLRPAALIRVVRTSDGTEIGRGMTDGRGEALVAVHGIPVTTFGAGTGPVIETEVPAELELIWDPDEASHTWPDPDRLAAERAARLVTSKSVQLTSGQHIHMQL